MTFQLHLHLHSHLHIQSQSRLQIRFTITITITITTQQLQSYNSFIFYTNAVYGEIYAVKSSRRRCRRRETAESLLSRDSEQLALECGVSLRAVSRLRYLVALRCQVLYGRPVRRSLARFGAPHRSDSNPRPPPVKVPTCI